MRTARPRLGLAWVLRRGLAAMALGVSVVGLVGWGVGALSPSIAAIPTPALYPVFLALLTLLSGAALAEKALGAGRLVALGVLLVAGPGMVVLCDGCASLNLDTEHSATRGAAAAGMVFLLALALLCIRSGGPRRVVYLGHFLAFAALGLGFAGAALGLIGALPEGGTLAVSTAAAGAFLALALMLEKAHRGIYWLLFGADPMGAQVRRQIWGVTLVPMVTGAGFVYHFYARHDLRFFGDLVLLFTLMMWQLLLLLGISAIRLERQERARRRAEAQMARMALRDGLTGLANRTAFDRHLYLEALRAKATGQTFSLVLFDVDNFKLVNDTHGHMVGDEVLRSLGRGLRQCISEGCFVARLGGEEFALIVAGAAEAVGKRAEELRQAIEANVFVPEKEREAAVRVTASFGVSDYSPRDTLSEIYARVDKALYRAKAMGRNRVEVRPCEADGCNLPT